MAIRYKGSIQSGNNYDPLNPTDNSDRLREQSQAYIESLKRRRQQEAMQQAAFVEGMRRKLGAEADSLQKHFSASNQQLQAIADLEKTKQNTKARNADMARRAATGRPDPSKAVLDFVSNVVPQALSQFGQIKEAAYKADWEQGVRLGSLGTYYETIKQVHDVGSAEIIAATQNQMATYLEGIGEYEQAAAIRKSNSTQFDAWRSTQLKGVAQGALTEFKMGINDPSGQATYDLNGERVPLNTIKGASTEDRNKAWNSWFPEFMGMKGGYDVSPIFMHEAIRVGSESWQNDLTQYRKQELLGQKADYYDQGKSAFKINIRDANTAVKAVQDIFTLTVQDSQSLSKANEVLFSFLADPNIVPENVLPLLEKELTLPGRDKPLALDRPTDWAAAMTKRKAAQNQTFAIDQRSKANSAQIQASKLQAAFANDKQDDQDVDMPTEQYQQMYATFEAEGLPNDPRLAVLRSNEKYIASNVQQQNTLKEFSELAERGGLTEGMVFRSSLAPEQKKQLYGQIRSGSIVNLNKDDQRRAKQYIKDRILERTGDSGYIPNSTESKGYVNRAADFALQKFERDYVKFARGTDGKDPYSAAIGLFEAEMANEQGIYTVYTDDDILQSGANSELKGTFKNGDFRLQPNYQAATAPEETLSAAYKLYGDKTISTAGVVPRTTLDQINDDIQLGRRGVIPPIISMMADRYNTDPLTVLEQQFKANNIEYDENYFKPAKEVKESFNPIYSSLLRNNPKPETTDAALIGSGQQPIYQTVTPAATQVMDIVKSRESPDEGYNAMNNGTGGDRPGGAKRYFGKEFKDMTVYEVIQLQQSGQLHAAGAYQFVPNTLPEAMELAGIDGNQKFTPEVQDAMFMATFDKYGASKWAPYWGNPATQNEMNIMDNFQRNFDYQKPTWRQSSNMNPKLVYRIGSLGYGSTGPHLDVKPVFDGGVYSDSSQTYVKGDLDRYVSVKHNGKLVPLSQGTVTTDDDSAHRARGSFGHDYATPDGSSGQEVYLSNGAKIVENWVDPAPGAQGSNRMVIELPNGKRYAFVHGTGVTNG